MKVNWRVRIKNPWFWVGLAGVVLTAMGVNPETFTSWQAVADAFISLAKNPFMLFSVILAILGQFIDPTTKGLKDSERAMTYTKPYKD